MASEQRCEPKLNRARLVAALRNHLQGVPLHYDGVGTITVFAAHPAVGDLNVYLDEDEATVVVGAHHFHMGFTAVLASLESDEATDRLTAELAQSLADIFEDRTTFRVHELRFWRQAGGSWWRWPFAFLQFRTCRWTGPLE